MPDYLGMSGYPWEDIIQVASRVSGVKTAEAICVALARLAVVAKNDCEPQPHEKLKKWKIFKSDSKSKKLAQYDSLVSSELPSISKQNVYKKEISKYVKLIKAKSQASTPATKKEEEKQENQNNTFALPNGAHRHKFKTKAKRDIDQDAMDDSMYWHLLKYPDAMLNTIALALTDFVKNMNEVGSKKVVLFKKHSAIMDQLLKHVTTITHWMTILTKRKSNSAKSAKSSAKSKSAKSKPKSEAKTKSAKSKSKKVSKAQKAEKSKKAKKKSAKQTSQKAPKKKSSKQKSKKGPKVTSSKKAPPACSKWWKQCKILAAQMA